MNSSISRAGSATLLDGMQGAYLGPAFANDEIAAPVAQGGRGLPGRR